MTKTGTYKMVEGKLVKISDRVPNGCVFDVYVPSGGYWSENLGHRPVYVESRAQKRKILAAKGLREDPKLTKREI